MKILFSNICRNPDIIFLFFTAITCDLLDIEGATVTYSDDQNIGSLATITCEDENHRLVGTEGGIDFTVITFTTTCTICENCGTATWEVTDLACEGRLNTSILTIAIVGGGHTGTILIVNKTYSDR